MECKLITHFEVTTKIVYRNMFLTIFAVNLKIVWLLLILSNRIHLQLLLYHLYPFSVSKLCKDYGFLFSHRYNLINCRNGFRIGKSSNSGIAYNVMNKGIQMYVIIYLVFIFHTFVLNLKF